MKDNDLIVGNGMIANAFSMASIKLLDAVVFASGVSNSACVDQKQFDKERSLLEGVVNSCLKMGYKLVYFSSAGAVYGNCEEVKNEESIVKPTTEYGINKIDNEKFLKSSGVDYLILRVSNIVGIRQNQNQLIPFLVNKISEGKVSIYREASRDLIDVEDLVNWTCQLVIKADKPLTINMVSGVTVPAKDIVKELMRLINKQAEVDVINGGDRHLFSNKKLLYYVKYKPAPAYWKGILKKYYYDLNR